MKSVLSVLLTVILLHLMVLGHASASTIDFGFLTLMLPDGYSDNPGRGIDSRVGDITIEGKSFKIQYDDFGWPGRGPTKLSEFSKDELDGLIYYERVQDAPVETCVIAWFHPSDPEHRHPIVSLKVLGSRASFNIEINTKAALKDGIEALRALKVTKAKASNS